MSFSFSFSGDDIDTPEDTTTTNTTPPNPPPQQQSSTTTNNTPSAFPIPGKPQLPPTHHPLSDLLSTLPSKVAYGLLPVTLDSGHTVNLPRRELWDVRVQLMAEDGAVDKGSGNQEGLGDHDVNTGVYEGGFKSWESSVDLVKVLSAEGVADGEEGSPLKVIELGCGTALPSLALFQSLLPRPLARPATFLVADYNPSVLQLVTVPNFILVWALHRHSSSAAVQEALDTAEGELELTPAVLEEFRSHLQERGIDLRFFSGGWSQEFIDLLDDSTELPSQNTASQSAEAMARTLILGAETIYSPFALQSFTETIFALMAREGPERTQAYIGAKRLYFGVGGSLDDFIEKAQQRGGIITRLKEETEGVRRGVVRCVLPRPPL